MPQNSEVARRIVEMTEGKVFVAHNARFDYSFIRQEFGMLGYNFKRPMLDTVALSRRLLPGHKSYSLGNLCKDLGTDINGRHRASGDALATVRLLEMLLEKDRELKSGSLIKNRKASKLHPSLDIARLEEIPSSGIYFFHDEKGDIIYVGKSRNLSERVSCNLSNNTSGREMEMRSMIADITWERTGSELIALLMESAEIKSSGKPRFNRAQRRTGFRWGIYSHTDENGFIRFSYRMANDDEVPVVTVYIA